MNKQIITQIFKFGAVCGNILFVLWVLFNAMDEGFSGTMPEKLSGIFLIGLLITNTVLVLSKTGPKLPKKNVYGQIID
jgi:hypothetical protein